MFSGSTAYEQPKQAEGAPAINPPPIPPPDFSKRAWTVSAARRGAALAFCMVRHERLGAESVWGGLPAELLYYIVRAFVLV